ncbi:MAG: hypothetical protein MRY79_06440 [Alphaproteobacteria bacterium]|nr:hypothetical protein [Alphaproteobacteria bacterium]
MRNRERLIESAGREKKEYRIFSLKLAEELAKIVGKKENPDSLSLISDSQVWFFIDDVICDAHKQYKNDQKVRRKNKLISSRAARQSDIAFLKKSRGMVNNPKVCLEDERLMKLIYSCLPRPQSITPEELEGEIECTISLLERQKGRRSYPATQGLFDNLAELYKELTKDTIVFMQENNGYPRGHYFKNYEVSYRFADHFLEFVNGILSEKEFSYGDYKSWGTQSYPKIPQEDLQNIWLSSIEKINNKSKPAG